jgi:hypothetical protein
MKLDLYELTIPEGHEDTNGHIAMRHGQQYTLVLTNHSSERADAIISINGKEIGKWRIPALSCISLEHPANETDHFTFCHNDSQEGQSSHLNIVSPNDFGLVAAKFISVKENDQNFNPPSFIESDESRSQVINLRLTCVDNLQTPASQIPPPLDLVMPPPHKNQNPTGTYALKKKISGITGALKTLMWCGLGIGVISTFCDIAQLDLLSGSFTQEQGEANDSRQQMVGIFFLGIYITQTIVFFIWLHRVSVNCHHFIASNQTPGASMRFSSGWAIGCWFVPFLNLWRPYQVVKEIWRVSANPMSWNSEKGSALLVLWWIFHLISGFLGQASFKMSMKADSIRELQASTSISIMSGLADIPLIIIEICVISIIAKRQLALTSPPQNIF